MPASHLSSRRGNDDDVVHRGRDGTTYRQARGRDRTRVAGPVPVGAGAPDGRPRRTAAWRARILAAADPLGRLARVRPGGVAARRTRPLGDAGLREPAQPDPGDLGRRTDRATARPVPGRPARGLGRGLRRSAAATLARQWLRAYAGATSQVWPA